MSRFKLFVLLMVSLCSYPLSLTAQENGPKVSSYLTDTTLGFARVQLDQLDLEPVRKLSKEYVEGFDQQVPQIGQIITTVQGLQTQLVDAGATDLYVVVELENLMYGPYVLLEYREGADLAAITRLLEDVMDRFPAPAAREFKTLDSFLFAGDQEILDNITSGHVAQRPQLAQALESVSSAPLQVVICPSSDQLRAIREAVPTFPEPFQQLNGGVLARGLQFLTLGLHLEPDLRVRLVVQSSDAESAEALLQAEQQGLSLLTQLIRAESPFPGAEMLVQNLQMERVEDRLTLEFKLDAKQLEEYKSLLEKPVEDMRAQSRESQIINDLRNLTLAIHNWHDVYKVVPAHANYSQDGKPLLSWRVHILPFVSQAPLYAKFHLDEPWDSEHNKKLISQMPKVFEVDGSAVASSGRTGYVLPILKDGSGITTGTKDGVLFQEVADGLSNTAMIVAVDDEHSVIWTRPDDLVIDPDKPLTGLRLDANGLFPVAFGDGAVHRLSGKMNPKLWLKMLTRAGGEPFDRP